MATGTSAVGINPDYITEVSWWTAKGFEDRDVREAAEQVAFGVLKPALRSRQDIRKKPDDKFQEKWKGLFRPEKATGTLIVLSLEALEMRVAALERLLEIGPVKKLAHL